MQLRSFRTYLHNRLRFGGDVPFQFERIWINPQKVMLAVKRNQTEYAQFLTRKYSGRIFGGDWDTNVSPIESSKKYDACRQHFIDGVAWEDTGIYEQMALFIKEKGKFDGCRNAGDVVHRYERMDGLWHSIKENGFKPDMPEDTQKPREVGGVFVHIGRDGKPLFGSIGNHRFSTSRLMGLTRIPAQLGLIHPIAYRNGALDQYRS